MKRIATLIGCLVAAAVAYPVSSASAADGFLSVSVTLRAGPDIEFPSTTRVRAGRGVVVHGCVASGGWCDVTYGGEHGWVPAEYIRVYDHDHRPRRVYRDRIAVIGLPSITFSFDQYWDAHYRGRPWYGERNKWHDKWDQHPGRGRGHDDDHGNGRGRGHDRH